MMQQFDSFAQMQRDAAMRVMEMQRRAQAAIRDRQCPETRPAVVQQDDDSPLYEEEEQQTGILPEPEKPESKELTPEETERALVTAILLLLIRENADERLLFALLYIPKVLTES